MVWFGLLLSAAAAGYAPTPGARAVASISYDWQDAVRNRDVPVKIYYPKSGSGPFPVILFSHGLGGSREGYAYLGEYWAAHGYVSVHPQHHGSDAGLFQNGGLRHLEATLRQAIANPQNSIDRAQDIRFTLDQLTRLNREVPPLRNRLDLAHVGMAGHSFGAATTLMVVGERMTKAGGNYLDPRIKAAIAMSPPMFDTLKFDAIQVPVLVMTGTRDAGFTRTADRRTAYDQITSPGTCLVIFNGADHMAFSGHWRPGEKDQDKKFQPLMLDAATAFWDAHLRGDGAAKAWLEQGGFTNLMQSAGKFELK
jgi:predicted dienelactone hydrolase